MSLASVRSGASAVRAAVGGTVRGNPPCKRAGPGAHPIPRTMIASDGMSGHAGTHELDPLIARARAGEREGSDALLRRIRPLVYRWAWVRTADADEADDVTQTVLLRVHENIGAFEGRSSFSSWLYRITANAAAELHRRKGVMRRLTDRIRGFARPASTTTDPVERIENGRIRDLVSRIIESLPERQRVAFDLVDLQGYTPAEAAEMLESNATTLRVHLLRARRTIRSRVLTAPRDPDGGGTDDR